MKNILLLALYTILLLGCRDKQVSTQITNSNKSTERSNTPDQHSKKVSQSVVFDIPFLLKLSSSQIKDKLGLPVDEMQANVTDTERSLVYKKRGLIMTVNYIVETGQVDGIALANVHDTISYMHLVPLGNLNREDTTYKVEPRQSEKVDQYRGILVTPNPPVTFPVLP